MFGEITFCSAFINWLRKSNLVTIFFYLPPPPSFFFTGLLKVHKKIFGSFEVLFHIYKVGGGNRILKKKKVIVAFLAVRCYLALGSI